jgi:HSP20 family protein
MTTKSFGPLLEVARIQSEINRLFDNLLDLRADDKGGGSWIPNVDILENEDSLVMKIELPGVSAADLSLTADSGNVIVAGRKQGSEVTGEADFRFAERAFGPFRRVIHLGVPVNTRRARAVLKNGLLRICFPKVPNRRGEAVPIEVETE